MNISFVYCCDLLFLGKETFPCSPTALRQLDKRCCTEQGSTRAWLGKGRGTNTRIFHLSFLEMNEYTEKAMLKSYSLLLCFSSGFLGSKLNLGQCALETEISEMIW